MRPILAAAAASAFLGGPANADTAFLADGDRIIGTVIGKVGASLTVRTE
jgi:hypothetical protein